MNEYGKSYADVGRALELSGVAVRKRINSDVLTIKEMSALVDVLSPAGTIRVVFVLPRP